MAFEVDVVEPTHADGAVDSTAQGRDFPKLRFEPMRRKLFVPVDA